MSDGGGAGDELLGHEVDEGGREHVINDGPRYELRKHIRHYTPYILVILIYMSLVYSDAIDVRYRRCDVWE